jgi:hypothetical protein
VRAHRVSRTTRREAKKKCGGDGREENCAEKGAHRQAV